MTCNTHHINCLRDAKDMTSVFVGDLTTFIYEKRSSWLEDIKNIKYEFPGCFVGLGNRIMDPDGA